jgi:hypothetical protein
MRHPDEAILALFAGGETGPWARWKIARHIGRCPRCGGEVERFRGARERLRDACSEMPEEANWTRLAADMKANIRVGLAAGECVGAAEPETRWLNWRVAAVALPVAALVLAGVWMEMRRPAPNLASWVDGAVVEGTATGIEFRRGDRMLSLQHPSAGDVSYLVNTQGTVRARYVDSETGQITIHNVYPE